jgi:hypothetical protein
LNDHGESLASNGFGDGRMRFPSLSIVNPTVTVPVRSQREKYGALFYLGIAGLVLLIALIGWFGFGAWINREIWADVYMLHDPSRSESERIQAAYRLSRNPRFDDAQKMETSLKRDLPDLARYLLAEAVSTEAVARDPRAYALAVARSSGWPDWLRLVLARRLAYGAARGYAIPRVALEELKQHPDPMIGLWATYALAVRPPVAPDPATAAELEKAASGSGANGELAALLVGGLSAPQGKRERRLDEITLWLRRHHHQAAKIWQGWEVRDDRMMWEGVP